MKSRRGIDAGAVIVALAMLGAPGGCTPDVAAKRVGPLSDLPNVDSSYRVDPFIRAAVTLQRMGRDAAIKELLAHAQDLKGPYVDTANDHQVIILCRMLFTKRSEGEFRRPRIGSPSFLGQTTFADWPLEPIELVDGIPFRIVQDYSLLGYAEQGDQYLEHCAAKCDWSSTVFKVPSVEEKQAALVKLIDSPKLKRRLTDAEKSFFSLQIR